ncbi:hypothetical protein AX16_006593 [Volvariella volvacea WC 439]|nr:hypothetical protein AX16_006593 [Volvariella volvacea WC 439]
MWRNDTDDLSEPVDAFFSHFLPFLVTTQHQGETTRHLRAAQQRPQPTHQGIPLGPTPAAPIQPQPPQAHMSRMANGIQRPQNYLPNGTMPNGVGPVGMQPGVPSAPPTFSMGGPNPPQPNGIAGPSAPPIGQGIQSLNSNFQVLFPQHQRPPFTGPQRAPNGAFQSPTMGHSPQASVGTPGQQPLQPPQAPQQPQHPQAPMSQLGPPTPGLSHMNRGMPPPQGGPAGMNPMLIPGGQPGGTPTQPFQTVGRPPSRTATPGQGGSIQPSPGLAARQPPPPTAVLTDNTWMAEFNAIAPQILSQLKAEVGLSSKENTHLTPLDKQRIVATLRQRRKPGEGMHMAQPAVPPRAPQLQAPPQPIQQLQGQPQRKRNSTSPGEEHETLPRNESSPPERKRLRRSPLDQNAVNAQLSFGPSQPPQAIPGVGQPPAGPSPQTNIAPGMGQGQNMMGRAGSLIAGASGMPMGPPPPHSASQMGMNLTGLGGSPGMLMNAHNYRQSLQALHKNPLGGAAGSPVASDSNLAPGGGPPPPGQAPGPQFAPGPGVPRVMNSKMPPPASPAMPAGASSKDGAASSNKDGKGPDGSPRNGMTGTGPGGNPPTPGPSGQGQLGSSGPSSGIAPSPSALLNSVSGPSQQPPTMASAPPLGPQQQAPTGQPQPPQPPLQPASMTNDPTFDFMASMSGADMEFGNFELPDLGFDMSMNMWMDMNREDLTEMKNI